MNDHTNKRNQPTAKKDLGNKSFALKSLLQELKMKTALIKESILSDEEKVDIQQKMDRYNTKMHELHQSITYHTDEYKARGSGNTYDKTD